MLNTSNVNNMEEQVKECLDKLDIYKFTGPDGIYPKVLKELLKAISEPSGIIFQNSCTSFCTNANQISW